MPESASQEPDTDRASRVTAGERGYLFVYGSLRSDAPRAGWPQQAADARSSLARWARRVGRGSIQGRLYDVDWYPGAVSARTPSARIVGDVHEIIDRARLFDVLDRYEESASPRSRRASEAEYLRTRRQVKLQDGRRLSAWVYLFNAPIQGLPVVESGDYVAWLDRRQAQPA